MQARCNLTQPLSSSAPPSLCADTAFSHTLLRASDSHYRYAYSIANQRTIDSIYWHLPDSVPAPPVSVHAALDTSRRSTRHFQTQHSTLPDAALDTSLLSIAQLCRLICIATFTSTEVHVTHNQSTVLHGSKLPNDSLWSITQPALITSPSIANATHVLPKDAAFIKFTHAALGSPIISTLSQAVRRGYLHS